MLETGRLAKRILQNAKGKTIIEGGHYLLEEGKQGEVIHMLNPLSTMTFESAVGVYTAAKEEGKDVRICFLVGDLSLPPETRESLKRKFFFPDTYLDILEKNAVSMSEVMLYFESTLRNRADNRIKSAMKKNLVVAEPYRFILRFEADGSECQISNMAFGQKPVPNCRMILAQELADKESMGFETAINFYNAEVYKCRGKFVDVYMHLLNGMMKVINLYFSRDHSDDMKIDVKISAGETGQIIDSFTL